MQKRLTVSELVEAFISWNQANRRQRTAHYYADRLKLILGAIGSRPASSASMLDLAGRKLSWHHIQSLQRLYNWGEEFGLVPGNPFRKLRKPRIRGRRRVMNRKEMLAHLRTAGPRLRLLMLAMRETIARPQEIRGMKWANVDCDLGPDSLIDALAEGKAFFRLTEFKAADRLADPDALRLIPITPRLGRAMCRLLRQDPQSEFIFMSPRRKQWSFDALRCAMRRIRLRLYGQASDSRGHVVAYTFRHSRATELAHGGLALPILSTLLGHTNLATTQKYVHTEQRAAMNAYLAHRPADSRGRSV